MTAEDPGSYPTPILREHGGRRYEERGGSGKKPLVRRMYSV
jgi:hypothetical protein